MNMHVDVAGSAPASAPPPAAASASASAVTPAAPGVAPRAPVRIEDTGLEPGFLIDLLVKTIYRMGLERPSEIGRAMKLPIGIVGQLIEMAQAQRMMETLGQLGASLTAEMRYALTGKGREWALEALAQSEYFGPAPVTLEDFSAQIERQSIRNVTLTRPVLDRVFSELTLCPKLMERLGPAANCSASVLLYGPPGNGKSTIAEAICTAFGGEVYFPYLALETGRKFEIPFDALVVFSTNIPPKQLVDDAALRRLRYKILVDKPDRDTFIRIFVRTARKFGLTIDEPTMKFVLSELYAKTEGAQFAGFHPRFLIDQVKSISAFEGVMPQLRPDFLSRAWENLFTTE